MKNNKLQNIAKPTLVFFFGATVLYSYIKFYHIPDSVKIKFTTTLDTIKQEIGNLTEIFKGEFSKEKFEAVKEFIFKDDSNIFNFISNFNMDMFYAYLDTLTLAQEAALLQILIYLILMLTSWSILGVFFGNEIIKYFNLEQKFPSLAIFFKLRNTYQRYYLMWDIFQLFIVCIVAIMLNLFIFVIEFLNN